MFSILQVYFHPLLAFLSFHRPVPWRIRWRLLPFLPVSILTALLSRMPFWFGRHQPFSEINIPTRSGSSRVLVYMPPTSPSTPQTTSPSPSPLHPLHISLHPGAFTSGLPESTSRLDTVISTRLSTVVIAPSYRLAPLHPFPAAPDDLIDIITWLCLNARERFNANPDLLTIGGSSAGGTLALTACQSVNTQTDTNAATNDNNNSNSNSNVAIKAVVTAYAPTDLATPPWAKRVLCRDKFPKWDPLRWALPLYDAYAALGTSSHDGSRPTDEGIPAHRGAGKDPRCSPLYMDTTRLPRDVLMVVAEVDILVDESRRFAAKVRSESGSGSVDSQQPRQKQPEQQEQQQILGSTGEPRFEMVEIKDAFHGWLEIPGKWILEEERLMVYDKIVTFLGRVHERYYEAEKRDRGKQ